MQSCVILISKGRGKGYNILTMPPLLQSVPLRMQIIFLSIDIHITENYGSFEGKKD